MDFKGAWDWLRNNALIVLAVGGLITFGALGARVSALEAQIPNLVDVLKDVITMQSDIEWIKKFLQNNGDIY